MLKYHSIISFCIGLLFLIVVQEFATPEPIFRFLIPAFLLYAGGVTVYNRWYLKQVEKYNFWILIRPMLLLAAGFGIFLVIPSFGIRGIFLILTVVMITFFEFILGNLAENILLNETLIIAFGLFFAFFGAYHYLPAPEIWNHWGWVIPFLYLLGIFGGSFLLTRSFYEATPQSEKNKLVSSITIGLFCAELYWVLNFLQFHYSVLSLILFNIFYLCLILNYYHLFHNLNFKKIQFHLGLIFFC
ncbi:MAG TPA: hypothetical protein VE973_01635, partial [Candidatus Limnocylindria bacterium]|nr:hypothetical protein [Candidatus Limnocylindria bacterium]